MANMKEFTRTCVAAALAAGIGLIAGTNAAAEMAPGQSPVEARSETVKKVRKALERLPYYGVFDFLAFSVNDRVVTLQGYAHRPALKQEAEDMVRKATGAEVANKIEILPASSFDDRVRWDAYLRVYSDDFASRYVSGGGSEVRYQALNMLRFPGMEPYESYPVHIVVKDRKILLIGAVDNEFDKTSLIIRAGTVAHHLGVEDAVMVRGSGTR